MRRVDQICGSPGLEQWTTSVRAYPGTGTTGWGRLLSARLNPAPVVDPLPALAVAAPANPFDPRWAAYFKARSVGWPSGAASAECLRGGGPGQIAQPSVVQRSSM